MRSLVEEDVPWTCAYLRVCWRSLFSPLQFTRFQPTKVLLFFDAGNAENFYANVKNQELTKPDFDISSLFEKLSQHRYYRYGGESRNSMNDLLPFSRFGSNLVKISVSRKSLTKMRRSSKCSFCTPNPTPPKNGCTKTKPVDFWLELNSSNPLWFVGLQNDFGWGPPEHPSHGGVRSGTIPWFASRLPSGRSCQLRMLESEQCWWHDNFT